MEGRRAGAYEVVVEGGALAPIGAWIGSTWVWMLAGFPLKTRQREKNISDYSNVITKADKTKLNLFHEHFQLKLLYK